MLPPKKVSFKKLLTLDQTFKKINIKKPQNLLSHIGLENLKWFPIILKYELKRTKEKTVENEIFKKVVIINIKLVVINNTFAFVFLPFCFGNTCLSFTFSELFFDVDHLQSKFSLKDRGGVRLRSFTVLMAFF